MPEAVLVLRGVTRTYQQGDSRLEVFQEADLSLQPGEIVALIGPSGAGKSSMLHIAGLLERPDAGEVVVAGRATGSLADWERTRIRRDVIGFVYQFHHLLPEFSAQENVVLPQMIAGKTREKAKERAIGLLQGLGLGERLTHRPAELSGGEQQRVAIARALANQPRIVLADEPTGNLDPKTADEVFAELTSLVRDQQVAALIATHNHELARHMDRVLVLEDGHLAQSEVQLSTSAT